MITGGPGTGKTIISRAIAYYVGHDGLPIEDVYTKDIQADIDKIETYIQSDYVEFIQIHPSMTYEDIVYGIETMSAGNLTMDYAEKRIKQLCDRAIGKLDLYFIILDDIGRADVGNLLGNLLYAMEYRNQPVSLCDGNTIVIPDNVIIIITECQDLYGNRMEYALRRRFDYEKELISSSEVLNRFYESCLTESIKMQVLNVFAAICNFVNGHILSDPMIQKENYMPGHGMLMVERNGNQIDILTRIRQKFEYQLYPYLVDMQMSGILTATQQDLKELYDNITNQINVGREQIINNVGVQKILYKTRQTVPNFNLSDSFDYFQNTIIPDGCREHRTMIESIIDAVFTNNVFPIDKALSDILLNINVVRFEHRTEPGTYAAFLVEAEQNENYGYLTSVSNNTRSYYSSNSCRTGRWMGSNDAPAYEVTLLDGTTRKYIPLNAFRNTGFDTNTRIIHAHENTASIYCALYHLVHAYLTAYKTSLMLMAGANSEYGDIYKLVGFEKEYWELKNVEAQAVAGSDAKLRRLTEAALNIKTLWNSAGTRLEVDYNSFANLASGTMRVSINTYENLYNITGAIKSIEIKGVSTMVDLKDYQQIMESIGVRQMIFQGPPGTSKTFESKKFVLKQLNPASTVFATQTANQEQISKELEPYKLTAEDYDKPSASLKLKSGGWDLVQFHPSYGYEDFIRGIEVKPVNGIPTYSSVNRILGKIAEFAKLAENDAGKGAAAPKFYLIIDEINRANLATVFGELIYGLEYRDSKVSTPYEVSDKVQGSNSKDIVLGKNLFIIGTMNTADKSIDAIDYAIRRRFIFIDSPAQKDVVLSCYHNISGRTDDDCIEALLFDAVGYLFEGDRFFNEEYQRSDVRIGHTYFLRHYRERTDYINEMVGKFIFQVVPILREYVKDGIIDSFEDLINNENSIADISAAAGDDRIKKLGENIMLFIKYFGEHNAKGEIIDNKYISDFIEKLCDALNY
ncbi:MAG: AAA family ATPase [Butyrivibrio sp.]|nr:AAA family ATPase [Butyrivibrio sp.]